MKLTVPAQAQTSCQHIPPCPRATAADHAAAHVIVYHPEQGWSLLCNGDILFDDGGELLSDGRPIAAHRAEPKHRLAGVA